MLIKQKVFLSYRNCCSPGVGGVGEGRQGREGREYLNRSRGDDSVAMNESENSYTHRHKYIHTYSHNMKKSERWGEEGKKWWEGGSAAPRTWNFCFAWITKDFWIFLIFDLKCESANMNPEAASQSCCCCCCSCFCCCCFFLFVNLLWILLHNYCFLVKVFVYKTPWFAFILNILWSSLRNSVRQTCGKCGNTGWQMEYWQVF